MSMSVSTTSSSTTFSAATAPTLASTSTSASVDAPTQRITRANAREFLTTVATSSTTSTSINIPSKRITRCVNTRASIANTATSSSISTSTSTSHASSSACARKRKRSVSASTVTCPSTAAADDDDDNIDWSFMESESESEDENQSDQEYRPHTTNTQMRKKQQKGRGTGRGKGKGKGKGKGIGKKQPRITKTTDNHNQKTETSTQQHEKKEPEPEPEPEPELAAASDEKRGTSYMTSSSSCSTSSTHRTPIHGYQNTSTFVASSYTNMVSVPQLERTAHFQTFQQIQQQQLSSTGAMLKVIHDAPADRLKQQFRSLLTTTTSSTIPSWLPPPHVDETPITFFHRAMSSFLSHSASALIRPRAFHNSIIHLILSMLSLKELMKCRVLSHQWLQQSHNIASWSSALLSTNHSYLDDRKCGNYDMMILSISHVLRRLYLHGSSYTRKHCKPVNPLLKFNHGIYLPFPNLIELDIGHSGFSARLALHILRTCTKLQILRIDESCSQFQLTREIANLLPNTLTTLAIPIGRTSWIWTDIPYVNILSDVASRANAPILTTLELTIRWVHYPISWSHPMPQARFFFQHAIT